MLKKKKVSGEQAEEEEEEEEDWHCVDVDVDEEEEADLHNEETRMIGIIKKKNNNKNGIKQIHFHISIIEMKKIMICIMLM